MFLSNQFRIYFTDVYSAPSKLNSVLPISLIRILSTFFCLFRSCAVTSELSIQTPPQQLCAYPPPVYPFLDTPRGALEVLTATRVVAKFPHSPPFTYLVPASGIALQRFGQPLIRRRWCLRLTNCQRRQRQRRRQRRRRRRLRR